MKNLIINIFNKIVGAIKGIPTLAVKVAVAVSEYADGIFIAATLIFITLSAVATIIVATISEYVAEAVNWIKMKFVAKTPVIIQAVA